MKHDDSPQRGYQSYGLEKTAWPRDSPQDVNFLTEREGSVENNGEKVVQSLNSASRILTHLNRLMTR